MADNQENSFGLTKKRSYKDKYVAHKNSDKYYSGTDTLVYFNTIWVPEITSIAFSGTPTDKPIFGYSDEQWAAFAKGNYIVEGQISINFVETGYLHKVMRMVMADYLDNTERNGLEQQISETERYKRSIEFLSGQVDPSKYDTSAEYYKVAKEASETLKDSIWGRTKNNLQYIHRVDQLSALRAANGGALMPPLDILIMYGNVNGEHQLHKLADVRFVGTSQTVENNGLPIQEVYTFIARDLDPPEDVYGANLIDSAETRSKKDLTDRLIYLCDSVCDGVFNFITKKNSLKINIDFVNLKDDNEIVYLPGNSKRETISIDCKDIVSATLTSKFNADNAEIMRSLKDINYDFTKLRPQCLVNLLTTLSTNNLTNSITSNTMTTYVASMFDQLAHVNPYMIARFTRLIAPISTTENKDVRNGSIFGDVFNIKSFDFKLSDATKYTNKLFCLENWFLFNESDRVYFDTLTNISGTNQQKITCNSTNRTNYESLPTDQPQVLQAIGRYGSFDELWLDSSVDITDALYSIKAFLAKKKLTTHFYSKLAAPLTNQIPSNLASIMIDKEKSTDFDISYVEYPACLGDTKTYYTSDGSPISKYFIPTSTTDAGDEYTLTAYEKSGDSLSSTTEFLIPSDFANKEFTAEVFVDGSPCKSEHVTIEKEDGKFEITFKAYRAFDAGYSKIRVILVDLTKPKRGKMGGKFVIPTELDYLKNQKLYCYDRYYFEEQKNTNTFSLKQIPSTNDINMSSILSTLRTRVLATAALPAYLLSRSKYTKRVTKKTIPAILGFCDQYQYMFDFQEFVDSFLYDLSEGTKLLKSQYSYNFDDNLRKQLRERFRARFLKNCDSYILPKGIELRMAGYQNRQILVTVETDKVNNRTLSNFIRQPADLSNYGDFSLNVSVYTAPPNKNNREMIAAYACFGKLFGRQNWSLKQYDQYEAAPLVGTYRRSKGFPYLLVDYKNINNATILPGQIVFGETEDKIKEALGIKSNIVDNIHIEQADTGYGNLVKYINITTDETPTLVSEQYKRYDDTKLNINSHVKGVIPYDDLIVDSLRTKLDNCMDDYKDDVLDEKFGEPTEDKTGIIIKTYKFLTQLMYELKLFKVSC